MSAKRESLPQLDPLPFEGEDLAELHWPNNEGIEVVQVIGQMRNAMIPPITHAWVDRVEPFNSADDDRFVMVRRAWLKPIDNT